MKRSVRFEKIAYTPTCHGFCVVHTQVKVIRDPWLMRLFSWKRRSKIQNQKLKMVERSERGHRGKRHAPLTAFHPVLKQAA